MDVNTEMKRVERIAAAAGIEVVLSHRVAGDHDIVLRRKDGVEAVVRFGVGPMRGIRRERLRQQRGADALLADVVVDDGEIARWEADLSAVPPGAMAAVPIAAWAGMDEHAAAQLFADVARRSWRARNAARVRRERTALRHTTVAEMVVRKVLARGGAATEALIEESVTAAGVSVRQLAALVGKGLVETCGWPRASWLIEPGSALRMWMDQPLMSAVHAESAKRLQAKPDIDGDGRREEFWAMLEDASPRLRAMQARLLYLALGRAGIDRAVDYPPDMRNALGLVPIAADRTSLVAAVSRVHRGNESVWAAVSSLQELWIESAGPGCPDVRPGVLEPYRSERELRADVAAHVEICALTVPVAVTWRYFAETRSGLAGGVQ